MEWYVGIKGDNFDLEDLSESLNSPEFSITKKGEDYILKSTHFNSLEDADGVRNKASEILSLINGSAWLVIGMRKPLKEVRVCRVNDDGKTKCSVVFSDSAHFRDRFKASLITKDGEVQEIFQADPISEFITTALHDENVATALRLLDNCTSDWVNLYRILEVVEEDVGGTHKIVEKGWATKKAIDLFKHTANCFKAIGAEARHAKKRIKTPTNPMTPSEAESLIKTIVNSWIQSKK